MKNVITIFALFFLVTITYGQDSSKEARVKFQGGIWSGTNRTTIIVGVPAAKFSAMFSISKKVKLETGIMLIPGLIIDKTGERLGLSSGVTVTVRKDAWKLKPVVGVVFVRTNSWQLMPGIGFIF